MASANSAQAYSPINCHLIFENRNLWITQRATILGPILEKKCNETTCACGLGTQPSVLRCVDIASPVGESQHYVLNHYAILRNTMAIALEGAGFVDLRWLKMAQTGFHQPLILAKAP